jgi:hypothetical protein
MSETKIVLPEDDIAATLKTVTGWVSRDGLFFGSDERTARWSGATHVRCSECGVVTEKGWTLCAGCREKEAAARFAVLERRDWDGSQMVYSAALEKYFDSPEDALDDAEGDADSLRLVLCEPVHARTIEGDYFCDELPEDGDLPDELAEAIVAFNEAVKGVVLSWLPGKFALRSEVPK